MRRPTQRQPVPIRFDLIKARAQRAFAVQLQWLADGPSDCAARFPGLLDFSRLLASDHRGLTTLVAALGPAAAPAGPRQEGSPIDLHQQVDWEELWTQARAQGRQCIAQWDVRCVVSLIRYFPQCVGGRSRTHHAVCWIADDPDGHWVVSFAPHASSGPCAQDLNSQR